MLTLLPFVQSELGVEDVPSVSSVHDKKLIMNEDEKLILTVSRSFKNGMLSCLPVHAKV